MDGKRKNIQNTLYTKILTERTDENVPISVNQVVNILHQVYGISAHRANIANDIEE